MLQTTIIFAFSLPEAKLTLKVVDDDMNPVEGAPAGVTFRIPRKLQQGFEYIQMKGTTDSKGYFVASSESLDTVTYSVTKDGYYQSYGVTIFNQENQEKNKWQPWNPEVVIALRKIVRPVPMYARDTHKSGLKIPDIGKEIGFDLMEYDWVSPYGIGKRADFIFKLDSRFVSEKDFETTLTITFANKFDGMLPIKDENKGGSVFKLSRNAPATGYQGKIARMIKRILGKSIESNFQESNNFYFRIRSEEKNGKLLRAMYGKIQGNIEVYPTGEKTAKIIFKYYLNPDYTQNLEYDQKQNLFLNLRDSRKLEWVGLE